MVDYLIVTFIREENEAVQQYFRESEHEIMSDNPGSTRVISVPTKSERTVKVAIARITKMGNITAACDVSKLINEQQPELVLAVGIAGAVPRSDIFLGDVLLVNDIHDMTRSAETEEGREESAASSYLMSAVKEFIANVIDRDFKAWRNQATRIKRPKVGGIDNVDTKDEEWIEKIEKTLLENEKRLKPKIVDGAIASSDILVKSVESMKRRLYSSRDILANDMESVGMAKACEATKKPLLIIRGISDIVGYKRSDDWKLYACQMAASCARELVSLDTVNTIQSKLSNRHLGLSESSKEELKSKSTVELSGTVDKPTKILSKKSYFEFLRHSNDPECIRIHQWIKEWLSEIPYDKKSEFESRLKAKKDETFYGALFELQIHRMLRNLGLKIEVEPDLPGTGKKIDFRAHLQNQESQRFYLEAANCIPKESKLEGNSNEDKVINEIKKEFPNPHTDIWLETEGILKNTLGKKQVTKPIREFLEKYPPQKASQMYDIYHTLIEDGNWMLKACFKQSLNLPGPARIHDPFRMSEDEVPVLNELEDKAKKWKNFDFNGSPFIIAINVLSLDFFLDSHGERILFSTSDGENKSIKEFRKELHYIDGIIFVDNAMLSETRIRDAKVKLFKNGERYIPECLHFLLTEQRLGTLLGIGN